MECARSEIEYMQAGRRLLWSLRRSVAGPSLRGHSGYPTLRTERPFVPWKEAEVG
jgi:hypothetical protein